MKFSTPREFIFWKLNNVLKAQALFAKEDTSRPVDQRKQEIEIISDLKRFLDNYDEYRQVITDYENNKDKGER